MMTHVEHLLCDVIVCALAEVARAHVISSAQVDAEMHVGRALEAGVVELDVGIEHLVGGLVVALVGCPALEHGLGAEVYVGVSKN